MKDNKLKTIIVVIVIIVSMTVGVAIGVLVVGNNTNFENKQSAIDTIESTNNTNNESIVAPIATIKVKDYGTMKIELYYDEAPNTVKNFIALANNGFYDNLTFHRLVKDFMIQGGDKNGDGTGNATLKDINKGGNKEYCIQGEFGANNVQNKVSLVKGVIAMARTDYSYMYEELTPEGYDSASSQFFIMTADYTELDNEYAGFGKVIEGIDLLDKLNNVAVDTTTDKPLKPIIIEQIRVDTNNKTYELPETLDVLDYENYVVTGQKTYKKEDTSTNSNNTTSNSKYYDFIDSQYETFNFTEEEFVKRLMIITGGNSSYQMQGYERMKATIPNQYNYARIVNGAVHNLSIVTNPTNGKVSSIEIAIIGKVTTNEEQTDKNLLYLVTNMASAIVNYVDINNVEKKKEGKSLVEEILDKIAPQKGLQTTVNEDEYNISCKMEIIL